MSNVENSDQAFNVFLKFCKNKLNRDYFTQVLRFVLLFRACISNSREEKEIVERDILPTFSNDFFIYLSKRTLQFDENTMIDLVDTMRLFNLWLFKNNHTQYKLELISNSN